MDEKTEEPNFFQEIAESVPNTMSRLASVFTALWLSSTAAHPGIFRDLSKGLNTATKMAVNEGQAVVDPVGKAIAYIGGSVCKGVQQIAGVTYKDYEGKEPDMSQLTLVYYTDAKTVYYKLAEAAKEIPKESWWNRKLVIYIHGFTDNPSKSSFQTMLAAFKSKGDGDVNILALDASSLIKFFYIRASTFVHFIGAFLGTFIANLISAGLELKNVHLLGHSLGAHTAGYAGKTVLALTGNLVGRISGMDPAGPCFAKLDESERLSKIDADFVDVIHTDAGVYGLNEQIGHVDFWVNGGSEQPGCFFQTCSHSRAWECFAESVINRTGYLGVQCNNMEEFKNGRYCNRNVTSVMGYATPTTTRGNRYLITYDEEPYAAGVEGLTYKPNGIVRSLQFAFEKTFSGR